MSNFVKVIKVDELPPGKGAGVEIEGKKIAVFNADGAFYAVDDACPHDSGPLSQGSLVTVQSGVGLEAMPDGKMGHSKRIPGGPEVTCPSCGSIFDLIAGCCLEGPATEDVETFPVQLNGEDAEIDVEE